VTATEPRSGPVRGGVADPRLRAGLVFAASAVVLAAVRAWQIAGRDHLWWPDSADFLASARTGLFSLQRWAGPRPAAAPLLLSLARFEPRTYVVWQAAVAVVCWAALATSVWTVMGAGRARWLGALAVVAFSCTVPVTMWERSVLSESLAASTLALTVAAALQLARGVTGRRVAAVLASSALWLLTRDSHASVVLVAAVALGAGLGVAWWRDRRRRRRGADDAVAGGRGARALVVLACWLFALGALGWVAASHGNRYAYPLRNVFEARVLPYPDRVSWFAEHGMPQAERFVGPDAPAPVVGPGSLAPVVSVVVTDRGMRDWLDWVERDGRQAFAAWVATHPAYLVTEPLRSPERTFNNAFGDRSFYAPLDQRELPVLTDVLVPGRRVALAAVAGVALWATLRRRWGSPLLIVGAATVALAVPHALVSWHSDGMETARHLMVPSLQLYLGALLMVLGAVDGLGAELASRA